jgi:hypothetical protein
LNSEPKSVQVDLFGTLAIGGAAAFQRQPEECPNRRAFAGMIVAVRIGIGFDEPAPCSAFIRVAVLV